MVLIDHAGPVAVIGFNPYSQRLVRRAVPRRAARAWTATATTMRRTWPRNSGGPSRGWSTWPSRGRTSWRWASTCCQGEIAARHRAEGLPVIAWTVRSPEQCAALKDHCDNVIFEGFAA